MGKGTVDVRATIRAPLARVFDAISDHEGMAKWPGITSSRLVKEGTPRNGIGAVRRIGLGVLTLDEEVVAFDPPNGYEYSIIHGLPVDHRGTLRLTEKDGTVEVSWRVRFASRWPLVAEGSAFLLTRGVKKALAYLKERLEGEGP